MPVNIPLTQGLTAVVDDADAHFANFSWHAHPSRGLWYARRSVRIPGTRKTEKQYLHRAILSFPEGRVDHRNGNTLDNRRGNLRMATGTENQGNARMRKDNATGFKGVRQLAYARADGVRVAWTAKCRRKSLGIFERPEDAAIAYDCEAIQVFGPFASLNEDVWRYISGNDLVVQVEYEERQAREKELRAELAALRKARAAAKEA